MSTPPTDRQKKYARDLQEWLQEKTTFHFDRNIMLRAFLPDPDQELLNQAIAARKAGDHERDKEIQKQEREQQRERAHQAMDNYLARLNEMAEMDISTLDRAQLSAWIDEAKRL